MVKIELFALYYTFCIIWGRVLFFGAKIIYISRTKRHNSQKDTIWLTNRLPSCS